MNRLSGLIVLASAAVLLLGACRARSPKIPLIFDTDTNNEVDDQFALGYLLFSSDVFDLEGITTNATRNGGGIAGHTLEAERILRLCKSHDRIALHPGAERDYDAIRGTLPDSAFDGHEAVDFLIERSKAERAQKLTVLAVGKLTNLALALDKDPEIARRIKIVWLGSNFPQKGEYNLDDDIPALQRVLRSDVEFEVVTVRYNRPDGTDAVRISRSEIRKRMPGAGPRADEKIEGRNGGRFDRFGDYAENLFTHFEVQRADSTRALYDMAAVAILKNPAWAASRTVVGPSYSREEGWSEHPGSARSIRIRENFDRERILEDFFETMQNYRLP